MFSKDMVSYNGYLLQTKRKGVTTQPRKTPLADYSFGENAWDYLDKITQLCKEKNIRLVLMKAPTIYPVWYDEWEEQITGRTVRFYPTGRKWKNDMKQRKEQQIDEKILDNGAVYCSDRNFTCRLRHSIRQQCKKSAERLHFYHR